jgi:hypothetical protein
MSTLADFTLQVAPGTGAFLVGYTSAAPGGEMRIPLLSVLSGLHVNPTLQGYTLTASPAVPSTQMGANVVDVTKPINTFVASGGPVLTFNNLAPSAGTVTTLELTAISGDANVVVPTGYSLNRGGNITGILVPNNTTLSTSWRYNGARWDVRGDPVASVSEGSFVKANSGEYLTATFVSGTVIAPSAGNTYYTRWPWNATPVAWSVVSKGDFPSGLFSVWQIANGTALPTVANTIVGTKPALTVGNNAAYGVISNWNAFTGNSIVAVNCDLMTGAAFAEVKIYLTRT